MYCNTPFISYCCFFLIIGNPSLVYDLMLCPSADGVKWRCLHQLLIPGRHDGCQSGAPWQPQTHWTQSLISKVGLFYSFIALNKLFGFTILQFYTQVYMVADEWYNKGSPQFCSKHGHEQSAHWHNGNIFAVWIHWKKVPMNVYFSNFCQLQ